MRDAQNPVRRHVRRIDIWAVTKVSLLFFAVVGIIWLVTALVIWRVLHAFDLVDKIEDLAGRLVGGDFRLRGSDILKAFMMLDVVWVVGAATFTIILAVVYNLIADVVGGITFVVEDKVPKRDRTLVAALRSRLRGERGKEEKTEPRVRPAVRPGRPARPAARAAPKPGEAATPTRRPVRPAALAGKKPDPKAKTAAPAAAATGTTKSAAAGKSGSGAAAGKAQVTAGAKSPPASQAKSSPTSPAKTKGAKPA